MKRIILILILLGLVWVLSYALAFVTRDSQLIGFRYQPGGRLDFALYPLFEPLYRFHGILDPSRPKHERDR